MTNRRDGGIVIMDVEDQSGVLYPVGLRDDALGSWRYDDVADRIATFADPSVSFELEIKDYEGSSFVVLHVDEFTDIPVLCKRDLSGCS